jgi:predicted regulator of amino acid metabolism with ACT domain
MRKELRANMAKAALEGFRDIKIGQVTRTVKYADDFVLLAEEEAVLQGLIDRLIEIGRYYGIEMNVEKCKVMTISRQPTPVQIITDQKELETVKYSNCLLA